MVCIGSEQSSNEDSKNTSTDHTSFMSAGTNVIKATFFRFLLCREQEVTKPLTGPEKTRNVLLAI